MLNRYRKWLLGWLVLLMAMPIYAQGNNPPKVETPFNVGEIIERISHHPVREGEKIVIKDQVYEATFDERGVVLKARETKGEAQDLVIPLNGRPEIRDGRVIYQGWDGEIAFEGTSRGLRFVENPNTAFAGSMITNYSGNVAKLAPPLHPSPNDFLTLTHK